MNILAGKMLTRSWFRNHRYAILYDVYNVQKYTKRIQTSNVDFSIQKDQVPVPRIDVCEGVVYNQVYAYITNNGMSLNVNEELVNILPAIALFILFYL